MLKPSLDTARLNIVNSALLRTERVLTGPKACLTGPWYKHQIYAPGLYTGYGVKTIPGVREAVDTKDWSLAQKEAVVVEQCLEQLNQAVNDAILGLAGI